MNNDFQLKVMAYLDGELPEREARQVASRLSEDPEARALLAELRMSDSWLEGHEAELKVPDSREFYWSKIERAIERADAASVPVSSRFEWRKLLAPLAGLALVVALGFGGLHMTDYAPFGKGMGQLAEIENESEHMGSFSFRSQAGNMFVVWIYDRTMPDTEVEPEIQPVLDDDVMFQ